jgi:hypothetical protein
MRRALALALLMVAGAFTGCVGTDGDVRQASTDEEPDDILWSSQALEDGHDHTDRDAHANLTTENFETIGHDPLVTEAEGTSPGGSSCADVNDPDEGERIGAQKAADSRGIVITDLSDPTDPKMIGELWLTFTLIYDVAVTPEGNVGLVTSYPQQGPAPTADVAADEPLGYFQPCGGDPIEITQTDHQDPVPRPVSLLLVDLSDPSEPQIADQRPMAGLGHSVFSEGVGERDWLVGVTESLVHGGRQYYFTQTAEGPQGPTIEPLSTYVAEPNPDHADYLGGHTDAWIQEHPQTGQLVGYLSAGPQIELVDLSNPRAPQQLSTWTDIGPDDPGVHNLHSLEPYEQLVNGTHYTIVGPELGSPADYAPTGVVWVLDTTDPEDPKPVAAWTLPDDVTWEGRLQFSPHYMDKHDDTLFISMYHGGVWAVDLSGVPEGSPEDVQMLDSAGVYVPAKEAPLPDSSYSYSWIPNLEEVFVVDEDEPTLVTFDANTGVYSFTYDDEVEVPTPEPYDLDPAELLPGGGSAPTQAP